MSPQPARDPGWTCSTCESWNEGFRTTCRNESIHPAPESTEES